MAFPVQFPTCQNIPDEKRPIKLTCCGYFKTRHLGVDGWFGTSIKYLFFALFVTETHLATFMTTQSCTRKPFTSDRCNTDYRHEVGRLVRNKDVVRFKQPLTGTPAEWEKTTRDLSVMIRQLGTPTFCCTFSAAEMCWPEVIEAIKMRQLILMSSTDPQSVTYCEVVL